MLDEYNDILKAREVMKILGVSKELLYELVHTEQLPAYRIGKKGWRFNKQSLISHLTALENKNKNKSHKQKEV